MQEAAQVPTHYRQDVHRKDIWDGRRRPLNYLAASEIYETRNQETKLLLGEADGRLREETLIICPVMEFLEALKLFYRRNKCNIAKVKH